MGDGEQGGEVRLGWGCRGGGWEASTGERKGAGTEEEEGQSSAWAHL